MNLLLKWITSSAVSNHKTIVIMSQQQNILHICIKNEIIKQHLWLLNKGTVVSLSWLTTKELCYKDGLNVPSSSSPEISPSVFFLYLQQPYD